MNSDMSEARRSSRPHKVASYGEEADIELPPLRKRAKTNPSKSYMERKPHQMKVATAEKRANAMERAEKLQSSLQSGRPSFIRSMIKSHVYTCYWLSIPTPFCKAHLPSKDQKIILENEKGEEYETNFLANRTGLSGGWRGFALTHKLHDGDAVVFELTELARFKVYIVRAHDLEEENDAIVTHSVEEQNMEENEDDKILVSEKTVELANSIKEKAANPRLDSSRKRRRKPSKPVKSEDGVSSSKIVEDDDTDDVILNGAAATSNQGGEPLVSSKIKLFRRRSVTKTKLFSKRRRWA